MPSKLENPKLLRSNEIISIIIKQLKENEDQVTVPIETLEELASYISTAEYIPKIVDVERIKSVRQAQSALQKLQANLDRVVAIHFQVRDRIGLCIRMETRAKAALIQSGIIPDKASGVAQQLILTAVLPELVERHQSWLEAEKRCSLVQKNITEAKDVIKVQTKLDDNVRWASSQV